MVTQVAVQLEQPFGDDQNDLPLDSFCATLKADLITLIDEQVEMRMHTDDDEPRPGEPGFARV